MDFITKNLKIIADCIQNNTYKEVETERFELKDLSSGWGDDWYKTVCAFLNTNGGTIVIGIKDKNNTKPQHYKFSSYTNSDANEKHLKQDLPKKFTNKAGNPLDLSKYISKFEIRDFLSGKVVIVYVEGLPDDEKYAYYNSKAYIRKLTGDHELSSKEVEEYEEIKADIISVQELAIIKEVNLDILNIDTLNQYIVRYNAGKKRGETIKTDLASAMTFLTTQNFIRDNHPTLLGMLVCGEDAHRYLQGKCESDCYVVMPKSKKIAQSKEIIYDNIVGLIEGSFNFIWRNIQIGIIADNSGTADPEYPKNLIREIINNAFAHRNYKTDRFVIIEVRPNESLMIRNPGAFKRRQRIYANTELGKIRCIIPIQVARNPKLAELLKSFEYWEGKGKGLTSLIDTCLDNLIDVPYYILTEDEIKLYIPKGKVYDDKMEIWLNNFERYIAKKMEVSLTLEEKIMLSFFRKAELLNRMEHYTILITIDNNHKQAISHLVTKGLLLIDPQSPALFPVYRVDRLLMNDDFFGELIQIIGSNEWYNLTTDDKEVLNTLYTLQHFGKPAQLNANHLANVIFIHKHSIISNVLDFEKYKAKVRGIITKLEKKNYITRKDGKTKAEGGKPDFIINTHFQPTTT
jgi:ATP-dependent DNA helicase RecG